MKIEITNVNKGICQSRTQQGKDSFFVNWQENGQNQYQFFNFVSSMYRLYDNLKAKETIKK